MPPVIYRTGIAGRNYPTGRPYVFSGASWLNAEFSPFTFTMLAGKASIEVEMPVFEFSGESASNTLSASFPVSTASFNVISGGLASFNISFPKFAKSLSSKNVTIEAAAIKVTASGLCYQIPSINIDVSAIKTSLDGDISSTITIISPDPEGDTDNDTAYTLEGDVYLVVNLKTKSHTTYRDGNNNAIAKTAELTFSSQKDKNVSDAYIMSRSTGDVRFISKSAENTERTHNLTFKIDDDGNLKNKKVRLAKGIRGGNWQFSVASKDGDKLEVRNIDLVVNELKRRI